MQTTNLIAPLLYGKMEYSRGTSARKCPYSSPSYRKGMCGVIYAKKTLP
jgi:hypothetical protein